MSHRNQQRVLNCTSHGALLITCHIGINKEPLLYFTGGKGVEAVAIWLGQSVRGILHKFLCGSGIPVAIYGSFPCWFTAVIIIIPIFVAVDANVRTAPSLCNRRQRLRTHFLRARRRVLIPLGSMSHATLLFQPMVYM